MNYLLLYSDWHLTFLATVSFGDNLCVFYLLFLSLTAVTLPTHRLAWLLGCLKQLNHEKWGQSIWLRRGLALSLSSSGTRKNPVSSLIFSTKKIGSPCLWIVENSNEHLVWQSSGPLKLSDLWGEYFLSNYFL